MDQPATLRSILQRGVVICLPSMRCRSEGRRVIGWTFCLGFKIDQSDFLLTVQQPANSLRFPAAFPPCSKLHYATVQFLTKLLPKRVRSKATTSFPPRKTSSVVLCSSFISKISLASATLTITTCIYSWSLFSIDRILSSSKGISRFDKQLLIETE